MADGEQKRTWADVNIKSFTSVSNKTASKDETTQGIKKTADMAGTGQTFFTRPIEYRPEYASPDRWSFILAKDRRTLNSYWRMFYALDALAGTVVDLYAEMPLSDYEIIGAGVDGEIKIELENMCEEVRFIQLILSVMKEFLIIGESIPHLFFDKDKGYWTDWSIHKSEDVEVIDTQLLGMPPILRLSPQTQEVTQLKKVVKAAEAAGVAVPNRAFLDKLLQNKKVMLEPLNVSYIPRLLHPYEVRGMSLFSRLWRIFMYEDAVMNASLQTAKRHSSPVKTVSIGDIASGFIPTEEQENALLNGLAQAEQDPHAWILVPPSTKFDAWGTVDKIMGIRQEYDIIERLKLTALGVNKDFIAGSSTFASAQAGLQVFLSRLLAFRAFIEETFINPKVFGVLVKARKWTLPTKAEVDHKIIVKNKDNYVKPRIRWEKALKSRVDKELLDVYKTLVNDFKIKVSERTIAQAAGLEWADEIRKSLQERKIVDMLEKKVEEASIGDFGTSSDFGMSEGLSASPETNIEEVAPEPKLTEEGKSAPMHAGSIQNGKNKKKDTFLTGSYSKVANIPAVDIEKL